MTRLTKLLTRTLSFRLSLTVLIALATLLMVALIIMFSYSRRAVKEEALLKASQTLEATVQRIDNILLSVEQSSGNIYWKVINHVDHPDKLEKYRRILEERNPYISHCTITLDSTSTLMTDMPRWTEPRKEPGQKDENITSFCLPIYQGRQKIGVMAVDVPLTLLSKIVLNTKPSPNSFSMLLGKDGSFIVHPDSNKLKFQSVFVQPNQHVDPSVKEAAQAMISGETGYRHVRMLGDEYYVFFKPFERSVVPGRYVETLGWSAGIVYPEDEIFGDYNQLLYTVLVIAAVGLSLLFLLGQVFIRRQLMPLQLLSQSAQRIAEGHYNELIPDSRQQDEVGRLQNHFQEMQQSLATHMGEMEQLTTTLEERGKVLQATYEQAKAADKMKTNFLYNMTNEMIAPVDAICSSVETIRDDYSNLTEEMIDKESSEIMRRGGNIIALLNQLIADSEKKVEQNIEQ